MDRDGPGLERTGQIGEEPVICRSSPLTIFPKKVVTGDFYLP